MNLLKSLNQLDLVTVKQLIDTRPRFFVPAYQRGYRWNGEQAVQLIDDLLDFACKHGSHSDRFYCLQPLVVKSRMIQNESEECLEVIDGQQRLTSILLIIHVLHLYDIREFLDIEDAHKAILDGVIKSPPCYTIKYETRDDSSIWLREVSNILSGHDACSKFESRNCDYFHIADVFKSVYFRLSKLDKIERSDFRKILCNSTRFIWYNPEAASGTNAEIFDRLNDGKIGLNNAELIKAIFLQQGVWPPEETARREALALQWAEIETRLREDEFRGFICGSRHPFVYESQIEYLFDILKKKNADKAESRYFTFTQYLNSFRSVGTDTIAMMSWVKKCWAEVCELFDTLEEWYADRSVYHRIGYILEHVSGYDVPRLREELGGKGRSRRIAILDRIIRDDLVPVKPEKLFYKKPEMTKVLYLYNVLLEDRRSSRSARFSFSDYKAVGREIGWDQEHIASHIDAQPNQRREAVTLACDLLELLCGTRPDPTPFIRPTDKDSLQTASAILDSLCFSGLPADERQLCEKCRNVVKSTAGSDEAVAKAEELFKEVKNHYHVDDNEFRLAVIAGHREDKEVEEKDFIWNFVLLNSSTNRSYGNNVFPVKRKRILNDEFKVYTPVGTRNVFEKACSRKIDQMLSWTRLDAFAYWEDIVNVIKPYKQLTLPFKKP